MKKILHIFRREKWSFAHDKARRNVLYVIYGLLSVYFLAIIVMYNSAIFYLKYVIVRIVSILIFLGFYSVLVFVIKLHYKTLIWFAGTIFFWVLMIPPLMVEGDPILFYIFLGHLVANFFYFDYKGYLIYLVL